MAWRRLAASALMLALGGCFSDSPTQEGANDDTGSPDSTGGGPAEDSGMPATADGSWGSSTSWGDGSSWGWGSSSGTTDGGRQPPLLLYPRACMMSTKWYGLLAPEADSTPLMCGPPGVNGALVLPHDTYMLGNETRMRVIETDMPEVVGPEIGGEFENLDLGAFLAPVLRGQVRCADEDGCNLEAGIDIFDSVNPDAEPVFSQPLGPITSGNSMDFNIDLGSYYVPGEFSILVYASVPEKADQSDRAFWVDLRIMESAD